MGDFIKPIAPHSGSHRVSDEHDQPKRYSDSTDRDSDERRRPREVDEHSEIARTDEAAWDGYFSALVSSMFLLFENREMYKRYISIEESALRLEEKSFEQKMRAGREDAQMRQRWDSLTDAFRQEFERVRQKDEALKSDRRRRRSPDIGRKEKTDKQPIVSHERKDQRVAETAIKPKESPLSFEGVWITDPTGLDVKVGRVFYRTDPTVPRLRRRSSRLDDNSQDQRVPVRDFSWLRIDRKTPRRKKRDDKLAEAA